jgi:hypothetical protein
MGKYSNAFFSETTNMIKAKLYMNVHWMVLYNLQVFCSDMKFKMAATAGNESILLALAAMLNIRLERKTETLQRTTQGPFLLSLVPIGPLVSEKKLEM